MLVNGDSLHDPLLMMPLSAASTISLNARVQHVPEFINTHEADAKLGLYLGGTQNPLQHSSVSNRELFR